MNNKNNNSNNKINRVNNKDNINNINNNNDYNKNNNKNNKTVLKKIENFMDELNKIGVNKCIVLQKSNITYFLENYFPSFGFLIFDTKDDICSLYLSKMDYEIGREYFEDIINIKIFEDFKKIIKNCDGIEDTFPVKNLKYVDKDYKIVSDIINSMKMIKNHNEIELIKKSCKISDYTINHIMDEIINNYHKYTEISLAAEIEYIMKKNGSLKTAFDTIVLSDYRSRFPHGEPKNRKIKDIVLIDMGAMYGGIYCSDISRTVILNRKKEYIKIYNIVKESKEKVEDLLKEGTPVYKLDEYVREELRDYKKYFIHSLGHGVGTEVHEEPRISIKCKDEGIILKENMVITIEPGIYLKDFGVRLEDTYLIKKNGFEKLTNGKMLEY